MHDAGTGVALSHCDNRVSIQYACVTLRIMHRCIILAPFRGADSTELPEAECVRAQKGLALPAARESLWQDRPSELILRILAAPVLFALAVVAVAKQKLYHQPLTRSFITPVTLGLHC